MLCCLTIFVVIGLKPRTRDVLFSPPNKTCTCCSSALEHRIGRIRPYTLYSWYRGTHRFSLYQYCDIESPEHATPRSIPPLPGVSSSTLWIYHQSVFSRRSFHEVFDDTLSASLSLNVFETTAALDRIFEMKFI